MLGSTYKYFFCLNEVTPSIFSEFFVHVYENKYNFC